MSTAPCESAPTPCPTSTSTWRSRPPGPRAAVGATLAAVRRRGVMVQLGMFPPGPRPAELSALVAKEIDYRGAFRFDTEFDDSIALLAGSAALDPVITHTFDLLDAVAAMEAATTRPSPAKSCCACPKTSTAQHPFAFGPRSGCEPQPSRRRKGSTSASTGRAATTPKGRAIAPMSASDAAPTATTPASRARSFRTPPRNE